MDWCKTIENPNLLFINWIPYKDMSNQKLSAKEKKFLIDRLEQGDDIPFDFKHKLFPTIHKEYELSYAGKMRKEDILGGEDGVTAVPLQIEKTFNGERDLFGDGWKNMIMFGDNLQILKSFYRDEDPLIKGKVKGKVKLIYIDPPFATESDFKTNQGQKAFTDKAKDAEFIEFIRRRLIVAKEILAPDGSIFVHLDQKKVHYIKVVLDEIFGERNFKNEIVWKRTSAHSDAGKLGVNADYILYYSRSDTQTWNQLYEYYGEKHLSRFKRSDPDGRYWTDDNLSAKGLRGSGYNYSHKGIEGYWRCPPETMERLDKENKLYFTSKGGIRIKKYLDELEGVPLQSIWDNINPVNSQGKERVNYPTQKPEALLETIIKVSTNPGDIVFDFFGGSGTTASVAEKLGRKWIVCDIGKLAFYTIQKRILQIQDSKSIVKRTKKYGKQAKSFVTVNTGLYDLPKLFELQKEEYIRFVMNLFEVTPQNKSIGGITVHGERKDGYNVIIWEYWKFGDVAIDEIFLEHLHDAIGTRLGDRIYIIVPANKVQFIDDYVQFDRVRYYFLKVPYQIINELHKEKFKKFRQPTSKNNVNALEDAIGFHFIRQPEVSSSFKDGELVISDFLAHYPDEETGKEIDGFGGLSMIIIDANYDGKDFLMSKYFFADDLLKKNSDHLSIKLKKYGSKIGVVYVDIYGNEFREEIKTT